MNATIPKIYGSRKGNNSQLRSYPALSIGLESEIEDLSMLDPSGDGR